MIERCPKCARPGVPCLRCAGGVIALADSLRAASQNRAMFVECYELAMKIAARESQALAWARALAHEFNTGRQ